MRGSTSATPREIDLGHQQVEWRNDHGCMVDRDHDGGAVDPRTVQHGAKCGRYGPPHRRTRAPRDRRSSRRIAATGSQSPGSRGEARAEQLDRRAARRRRIDDDDIDPTAFEREAHTDADGSGAMDRHGLSRLRAGSGLRCSRRRTDGSMSAPCIAVMPAGRRCAIERRTTVNSASPPPLRL